MKLLISNQNYNFDNNENGIEQLFNTIKQVLETEVLFFSHMLIDHQEIYDNHEDYIINNIAQVNEITVVTQTIKEFVTGLLISLDDYTRRAIPEIDKLINEFYGLPTEQSWSSLIQLLEGIEWIYQTVKTIDNTNHQILGWDELIKSISIFEVELPNLLEAIENKDSVLIADIIQYEVLPQFRTVNTQVEKNFEAK